jgi:hypothetical protein
MRWLLDGLEGQRFRAIAAGQAGDRYPGRIACSLRKRDDALWENSGGTDRAKVGIHAFDQKVLRNAAQ